MRADVARDDELHHAISFFWISWEKELNDRFTNRDHVYALDKFLGEGVDLVSILDVIVTAGYIQHQMVTPVLCHVRISQFRGKEKPDVLRRRAFYLLATPDL